MAEMCLGGTRLFDHKYRDLITYMTSPLALTLTNDSHWRLEIPSGVKDLSRPCTMAHFRSIEPMVVIQRSCELLCGLLESSR